MMRSESTPFTCGNRKNAEPELFVELLKWKERELETKYWTKDKHLKWFQPKKQSSWNVLRVLGLSPTAFGNLTISGSTCFT